MNYGKEGLSAALSVLIVAFRRLSSSWPNNSLKGSLHYSTIAPTSSLATLSPQGMKTSSRVFRSSGLNDDADLWQPLKLGSFEVVHTLPSQTRNLKSFLAAAYVGTVDNSNFEDIQRVLDTQPPGSVVGFDSRAWVTGALQAMDKPGIFPLTRTIHAIQNRIIGTAQLAKDAVAKGKGSSTALNM